MGFQANHTEKTLSRDQGTERPQGQEALREEGWKIPTVG